ncbi:hypothetical protein [Salinibacter ruber]|uniref:hypothetical protein n=1 Tax=Salinibacter ruber TaxID=146919 RepID=UPI002072D93F|nr:hypothetical protein [Salinibacter ruber]
MVNFGSKYTLSWTTPTADCRLWIKQRGYTSGSTSLDPAPTPISVRWGEQGRDDLTSPLRISTARIRFMGDNKGQMVEEVFDGGDTEYLVKFWRDTGSGYELEWEGYLATDLWRDNPDLPAEVIELEAIDGLALLKNRQAFTQVGSNDPYEFYRLSQALRNVLRGWDPALDSPADATLHDLPITTSQNWRPDGLDLAFPSTDQPFDELDIYNTAFQELDDLREPTGTLDQRTQLEGILERFGLTLMLSGGEWRLRQRDQIEDGTSLKTWTMPTGEGFFGSSETTDVTTSLPATARTEKPRSRASRLQRLKSSYSYDDLGQLVVNEGFEEPLSNGWTVFGTANRKKYVNSSIISTASQYFLNMGNGSFEQPDGQEGSFVKQNVPARFYDAGPGSALEVKWDLLLDNSGAGYGNAETRIGLGDYYAQARRIQIKTDVEPGKDATIQLKSPLPGAEGTVIIPEGMQVRTGDPSSDENENSITLTEPGRAGDESLTADVDVGSTIKAGDFALFFVWSDTTTTGFQGTREYWGLLNDVLDYPTKLDSHNTLNPQTLRMPLHTPQGIDLVDEDLSIAFWCDDSSSSSIDWNLVVDNISVQLLVGGEAIEETRYIADSGEYGREQTLSHRIGDGPTAEHPRGIFDASGQKIFGDWGYEAGQGETGKLLEQLLVEQWMRQQRDTLDRRTYEVELRGSDSLKPHHVVGFDGKTYTVSYLQRSYGTGGDSGRVELTEKTDAGTGGLTRAFSMESETGSGGSGSTVINTGDQTVEGASSWSELTGKPSGLYAKGGGTDEYPSTIPFSLDDINLTDGDITGVLGYTPADAAIEFDGGDGIKDEIGNLTQSTLTVEVDDTVVRNAGPQTFKDDVTIQGNLTVEGTRFVADVEKVQIKNNVAVLNKGETGNGVTAGFSGWDVDRGTLDNFSFGFDEERDRFVAGKSNRQVLATREDSPTAGGVPFWDDVDNRLETSSSLKWNGSDLRINSKAAATREDDPADDALAFWNESEDRYDTTGNLAYTDTSSDGSYAGNVQPVFLSRKPMQVWADSATSAPDLHLGNLDGLPKKDENGNVPSNPETFGVDSYGIWLRPGDRAVVEGNVEFDGGSWIVEKDGSFQVQDGITGSPLLKMGKANVEWGGDTSIRRGFHAYDGDGNVQAFFTRDGFSFAGGAIEGDSTNLSIDVSTFDLTTPTLNVTSDDDANSEGAIEMFDDGTKAVQMGVNKDTAGSVNEIPSSPYVKSGGISATGDGGDLGAVVASTTISPNREYLPIEVAFDVKVETKFNRDFDEFVRFDATTARLHGIDDNGNEVLLAEKKLKGTVRNEETGTTSYTVTGRSISANPEDYSTIRFSVFAGKKGAPFNKKETTVTVSDDTSNSTADLTIGQYKPRTTINSEGVFVRTTPNSIQTLGSGALTEASVDSVFGKTGNITYSDADASKLSGFDSAARSAVGKSDVGLGNVENKALSSAGWGDLGISQSDVSKSDVGLGSVPNLDPRDGMNMGNSTLEFQPGSSGGSVTGIYFKSNSNAGSDLAKIIFDDDYHNSNGEGAALRFRVENDERGSASGPDSVVFDAAGGVDIDRGELRINGSKADWGDLGISQGDISKGNVGLSNVPNVNPKTGIRNIELGNEEADDGWVGGQSGGQIGYDASQGFFVHYGSAGRGVGKGGVGKGLAVIMDTSNTTTGSGISISGGESANSQPTISLNSPGWGDLGIWQSDISPSNLGSDPNFAGNSLGFKGDTVMVYADGNSSGGYGWSGKDGIRFQGDNSVSKAALYAGHIQTKGSSEFQGRTYHRGGIKMYSSLNMNGSTLDNVGKINMNGSVDLQSNGNLNSVERLNVDKIDSNRGNSPVLVTQPMYFNGDGGNNKGYEVRVGGKGLQVDDTLVIPVK